MAPAPLILPTIFTFGDHSCRGDIIVEAWDGAQFCVSRALLALASRDLRELAMDPNHPIDPRSGLPRIFLEEDSDAVLAVLQAIHPLTTIPINSIALGLKVLAAAENLGLRSTLFRLDHNLQRDAEILVDPLGMCALAWNVGDEALLEKASRFTHTIPFHDLLARSWDLPGGFELLSAISATRLSRQGAIIDVVSALPGGVICEGCRDYGVNTTTPLIHAIVDLFNQPFPDTSRVIEDSESVLWTHMLSIACRSNQQCQQTVRNIRYSGNELAYLKDTLALVPQTILPWVVAEKFGRLRDEARRSWGLHA